MSISDKGWVCPKCERVWGNNIYSCDLCNSKIDDIENKDEEDYSIRCNVCNGSTEGVLLYRDNDFKKLFCSKECVNIFNKYYGNKR